MIPSNAYYDLSAPVMNPCGPLMTPAISMTPMRPMLSTNVSSDLYNPFMARACALAMIHAIPLKASYNSHDALRGFP
jgi:hypothetical protein